MSDMGYSYPPPGTPRRLRRPVLADGNRIGAAVVSVAGDGSGVLWLHRSSAQRQVLGAGMLTGHVARKGVVAVVDAAGAVTSVAPACGVIDMLLDDTPTEVGVVATEEFDSAAF